VSAILEILVVDDEPLARAGLRAILQGEPGVAVVGESATGEDAVRTIAALAPDVVFLDIALPDLDGFGVIERVRRERPADRPLPAVVFVTAHADQALRAFEVRALDYVTKPLRRDRVREAVARARERLDAARRAPAPPSPAPVRPDAPLALRTDGRLHLIEQGTIDWISADDDHVVVHAGGTAVRARETLQRIEPRLDPARFARIHRSTIVRLSRIRELQPWFHGDYVVVLHDDTRLRLSRSYRDRLAAALGCEL